MIENEYLEIEILDDIVDDIQKKCCDQEVYNLSAKYQFPMELVSSEFVKIREAQASKWISKDPSKEMYFTHGQYYHNREGQDFIVKELKNKPTSRRAILCAVEDTSAIMTKGDDPIPAFLILQFRLIERTLYVTAFFRAIEVCEFLSINIAEICLHCRHIYQSIPLITDVKLALFSSSAYGVENFNCCTKAKIDSISSAEIGSILTEKDIKTIVNLLEDKRRYSTYDLDGIKSVLDIIGKYRDFYTVYVIDLFNQYYDALMNEQKLHKVTNDEMKLSSARKTSQNLLDSLLQEIRKKEKKNE
jgi:hypothetical protein